jgi:hypothetical protein
MPGDLDVSGEEVLAALRAVNGFEVLLMQAIRDNDV